MEGIKLNSATNSYPTTTMSVLPFSTPGPNKEVMSSGGIPEPTFHVTICTLKGIKHTVHLMYIFK